MAKVSVMMITYNHEKFIRQALDSILMQKTDFDYEIVIGEDCSTDNTREIIMEYYNKFPNKIKLFFPKKNVGIMKNFLTTYSMCTGDYIAFIEGDDYWTSPVKLQTQFDYLQSHPDFSMCFCKVERVYESLQIPSDEFPLIDGNQVISAKQIIENNIIPHVTVMAKNYPMSELPPIFNEISTIGDLTMHLTRAKLGNVGFIDQAMAAYRIHQGGVSHAPSEKWFLELKKIYEFMDSYLDYKYSDSINKKLSYLYCQLSIINAKKGNRIKAKEYLKNCTYIKGNNLISIKDYIKANLYTYLGNLIIKPINILKSRNDK